MGKKCSSKNAPKKVAKAKKTSAAEKAIKQRKDRHLESVCAEIESLRASNGRIPRGEVARVFNEYKPIYNWLTIDLVKKGLKKYKDKVIVLDTVLISDLTSDTTASSELIPTALPPPSNVGFITPLEIIAKKGGRPIGATINLSREKEAQG